MLPARPDGSSATFACRMAGTLLARRPGDPAPGALGLPFGHPSWAPSLAFTQIGEPGIAGP